MLVYAWNYRTIFTVILNCLIVWNIASHYVPEKIWKILNLLGTCVALFIIFKFTIWGRVPQPHHRVVFAASFTNEFYREMIMNVFLYFPLGLSMTVVMGRRSVLAGLFLSVLIESWQFIAGTGLAQGTDIICNTLGVMIGMLGSVL